MRFVRTEVEVTGYRRSTCSLLIRAPPMTHRDADRCHQLWFWMRNTLSRLAQLATPFHTQWPRSCKLRGINNQGYGRLPKRNNYKFLTMCSFSRQTAVAMKPDLQFGLACLILLETLAFY